MSIRNLEHLFSPRSVALIGASDRPHSLGATVLANLMQGGFQGAIYPINPKHDALAGLKVFARVSDLPAAPDLAVLCTPPATLPGLIAELGKIGTRAAIILSAGLNATQRQAILDAARPSLLRILGPNCVGLLVPPIGLNASFAHLNALPGRLSFVSQSGALVTGVLDWARTRKIGFSKFISLGDSLDIDVGDVLDYLAADGATDAILLYVEDIRHARKFMSAARAAARSKPVLVVKSGRFAEGAKAAASHTGALAGSDAVYDAAIRRAGMLRVLTTEELFDAVETLAHVRPLYGERLTIMTNGGGPGVMATDALIGSGGKLADLSAGTLEKLNAILPPTWSKANPVDIIGDAPAERYRQTLQILLQDPQTDAVLFIHAPTAIVPAVDIATALVPLAKEHARNIMSCWLGGENLNPARAIFSQAGVPGFDTPEDAVRGFMQIVEYRRNQQLLMEVPPALPATLHPDRQQVRRIIDQALREGRNMLSEPEAKNILAAYEIPVVQTRVALTIADALDAAKAIGYPVALKILSPDISHKTDVGGVVLDLDTPEVLQAAAQAMQQRLKVLKPNAHLKGFTVQQMARRPQAQELIVGLSTDPTFGPVILFGQGGIAVEVNPDHAISLPPLNQVLAQDMISRTRVAKLLAGYRDRPAADLDAVCRTLISLSQLAADIGEIAELDINPLLADADGVIALDARIRIAPLANGKPGVDRFAIRPYPQYLEESLEWQYQRILLRPIRPEDGTAHVAFFQSLDADDVRYRMFIRMRELQPAQLARLTQIDYDREMAFIATRQRPDGQWETLGVARAVADPDNINADFAIIVRSDLKHMGLGRLLMNKLIAYWRGRGTMALVGESFRDNHALLKLVRSLGYSVRPSTSAETVMLYLDLQLTPPPSADNPTPLLTI